MALDLVAPIIPNAQDNKGAELWLQGTHTGLSAAIQFAEQRRQSEAEMARLAQQERISQEAHALDMKRIEQNAPLIDAHTKYYSALADLQTNKATAYANQTATAA